LSEPEGEAGRLRAENERLRAELEAQRLRAETQREQPRQPPPFWPPPPASAPQPSPARGGLVKWWHSLGRPGRVGLIIALVIGALVVVGAIGSSITSGSKSSSDSPASSSSSFGSKHPASRHPANPKAHAQNLKTMRLLARALKDVTSPVTSPQFRVDNGDYLFTAITLRRYDPRLRHARFLDTVGLGQQFVLALRSESGTVFRVRLLKSGRLVRTCNPAATPDCPHGHWRGSSFVKPSKVPKAPELSTSDKLAIRRILLGSVEHYANEFSEGRHILGTRQYASATAGLNALLNDPNSAAARFAKFRHSRPRPETDFSYNAASDRAASRFANGNTPEAASNWQDDIYQAQIDLAQWVRDGADWLIRSVSTSKLQADAAAFEKDLARARQDAVAATR
jgi:hypothetical protein